MKKLVVGALAVGPLIAAPTLAFADTGTTPAPPANGQASAVSITGVVAGGQTSANADQSSGNADANALTVGGKPLSDQTGGSAHADASKPKSDSSGALVDTGETPVGRVEVLPWEAHATYSDSKRTGSADAALARILLPQGLLTVAVGDSTSKAEHDGLTSTGSSSSDGATIDAGDGALDVVLLHAETSSSGKGSSYLLGVNGTDLVTSNDANGQCVLDVPQLVQLTCLSASGGKGAANALVAGADFANQQLPDVTAVAASSSGSAAAPAAAKPAAAVKAVSVTRPGTAAATGGLPFTGLNALGLALWGLVLAGAGGLAVWAQRRFARSAA